ncbi:Vms1/Ankzf1 family peptidyl-tRNA hydrolase [Actinomadura flavalba]|uniref:baeRF2 domain-containing protein n=1 Tax=Actinomadura flavalba TaxID=1120938 RepID=UPI000369C7C0|nr:Vms1/Ankzf1 family peptidyl-tRNA hydrolase [Actinomadura flavalba]
MDLEFLRPLYASTGPVASVHLDTSRDTADADKQIELRWRALRDRLAGQGADKATLDALEEVVGGVRGIGGPQGEALFASGGRVLAVHTMTRPPARDHASWLPVPDPFDLVLDRDHQLPYVVVAIDREGADIDGYHAAAHDPATERSFNGSTLHIQKVRTGGMAQATYHRRSENLWAENAAHTAADVEKAVKRVDAEAIFVAGDDRSINMMRAHLEKLGPPVVEIPGGRDDGAQDRLREALDAALEKEMIGNHDAALADFRAREAQGTAVEGTPRTLQALSDGQVETLLLGADRPEDEPWLYASAESPLLVATDPNGLDSPTDPVHAPATTLLLRSAVLGDAGFTELLDHGDPTEGTAATLRYTL